MLDALILRDEVKDQIGKEERDVYERGARNLQRSRSAWDSKDFIAAGKFADAARDDGGRERVVVPEPDHRPRRAVAPRERTQLGERLGLGRRGRDDAVIAAIQLAGYEVAQGS